jgi:hypothetical protein
MAQTLFSLGTGDWVPRDDRLTLPAIGTAASNFGSHDFDVVDIDADGRDDFLYV